MYAYVANEPEGASDMLSSFAVQGFWALASHGVSSAAFIPRKGLGTTLLVEPVIFIIQPSCVRP